MVDLGHRPACRPGPPRLAPGAPRPLGQLPANGALTGATPVTQGREIEEPSVGAPGGRAKYKDRPVGGVHERPVCEGLRVSRDSVRAQDARGGHRFERARGVTNEDVSREHIQDWTR